jgi:hypothetical protein
MKTLPLKINLERVSKALIFFAITFIEKLSSSYCKANWNKMVFHSVFIIQFHAPFDVHGTIKATGILHFHLNVVVCIQMHESFASAVCKGNIPAVGCLRRRLSTQGKK